MASRVEMTRRAMARLRNCYPRSYPIMECCPPRGLRWRHAEVLEFLDWATIQDEPISGDKMMTTVRAIDPFAILTNEQIDVAHKRFAKEYGC